MTETTLIGLCLEYNEVIDELSYLKPYHFAEHGNLFKEILRYYEKHGSVNDIDLRLDGIDVPDYVKASKHLIHQKSIEIIDNWQKSRLSKLTNRKITGDVAEEIEKVKKELDIIENEFNEVQPDIPLNQKLDEVFDDVEKRRTGEKESGLELKTLPTLNQAIGGIMPGDLIGIYGVEKSSKTTLAQEMCLDIAEQGHPVAIVSLEMMFDDMAWKSISMRSGLDINELRNPKYSRLSTGEYQKYKEFAYNKLKHSKLYIIDDCFIETEIYRRIKKLKVKSGIKLAVVDYLLLVGTLKGDQLRERVNHISRFFKLTAKKLKLPIILISQASADGSRAAEGKGLERDSNYFFYVRQCEQGEEIKFKDHSYRAVEEDYLIINRGLRHATGGKGVIVRFVNNIYTEIDTRSF